MKNDGTTFIVRQDNSGLWAVADVKPSAGTVIRGAELVEDEYVVEASTTMFDGRFKVYLRKRSDQHPQYCAACGGHVVEAHCTVCRSEATG